MDLMFNNKKFWEIPKPTGSKVSHPAYDRVTQVKFYNEYFSTGHKIFDPSWYENITINDEAGRFQQLYYVNRVSVPVQKMAIDIILAHLLGNKTHIVDGTLRENKALPLYKEYWQSRNIDTARYEFVRSCLSLADGALLFYRENGILKWQMLSYFNKDEYNMEYDKYGKPLNFYKFYDDRCDVYDDVNCTTYQLDGKWNVLSVVAHGFNGMPVVYHRRNEGAFWTPVQSNIDTVEVMLSRLSEDNRKKFKSIYHLKTHDPESVETRSTGLTDLVVTDSDGDFKLVNSANMSEQFKFEYETQIELIFNALGIVFPKHKSSGDMPTGSMKMMFYPTERVVMSLIHEFDTAIDHINTIVKQGFVAEYPEYTTPITDGNIRASIKMFTPQDDSTKASTLVALKQANIISGETASDEAPYSANNEEIRKEKEKNANLEYQRKMEDMRDINTTLTNGNEEAN